MFQAETASGSQDGCCLPACLPAHHNKRASHKYYSRFRLLTFDALHSSRPPTPTPTPTRVLLVTPPRGSKPVPAPTVISEGVKLTHLLNCGSFQSSVRKCGAVPWTHSPLQRDQG